MGSVSLQQSQEWDQEEHQHNHSLETEISGLPSSKDSPLSLNSPASPSKTTSSSSSTSTEAESTAATTGDHDSKSSFALASEIFKKVQNKKKNKAGDEKLEKFVAAAAKHQDFNIVSMKAGQLHFTQKDANDYNRFILYSLSQEETVQ